MSLAAFELSTAQIQALGTWGGKLRTAQIVRAIPPGTDRAGIEGALSDAYARYDVLRTRFERPVGLTTVLQAVGNESAPAVAEYDSVDAARAAELEQITATTPGVRAATAGARLVLTAATAIADEASLALLAEELLGGAPAEADPLQYLDYAGWEAEQLEADTADARIAKGYWAEAALADDVEGTAELPVRDTAAVPVRAPAGLAVEQWLAAWVEVQARHAGPDAAEVQLAVSVDGRVDADLRAAIGGYERYVPLTVARDVTATIGGSAGRIKTDLDGARRFAVFAPAPTAGAGFAARDAGSTAPATGAFALELVVSAGAGKLWYVPEVVDAAQASRIAAQLETLLTAVDADPQRPLADIDVRGPDEARQTAELLTGARADAAPDDRSIAAIIAEHAAARGDAPAVVHGDEQLTWARFGARVDAIAAAIPSGQTAVGVLLHRSAEQLAAAFGALRAGAAYVPLAVTSPPARIAEQLDLAEVRVVLTDADSARLLPDSVTAVLVDALESAEAPPVPPGGDRPAYLIFTSGSTGRPKPVVITSGNVLAYAAAIADRLGLDEQTRFAAATELTTDLGNTAIFGALLRGGTVELLPNDVLGDGPAIADLISRHGITALKTTPSHLRALLAGGDVTLQLPMLVVGGEALDPALVTAARAAGVGRVVNHYGPTETTIGVLTYEVPDPVDAVIPLGRPLDHVRAYVLDARGVPTPLGAIGRLAIAGPAVAAGYAGQPETTAERFVPEPGSPGGRMYLTGDDVRLTAEGRLEFLGRSDGQVKLRGFRVELGEIEARVRGRDGIEQAAAVVADDVLSLYVVASGAVDTDAIEQRLEAELPGHMVPQFIVRLDRLPLTPSGKLDRSALASSPAQPTAAAGTVAPRTETEAALAEIWRAVLPVTDFGVEDNFFRLGGHSLIATKVIARARARFGVDLPLYVIFASSTVAAMAAEIDQRLAAAGADEDAEDLAGLLDDLESLSDDDAARLLAEPSVERDDR